MNIKSATVTKMTVTDIPNLDPVNVFVEEYSANSGKITMECFGDAWSYYWGSIGERSIMEFFCACDNHYLCGKFAPQLDSRVIDDGGLPEYAQKYICEQRRQDCFKKEEARDLYDRAEFIDRNDSELMYEVFGDEWWERGPKIANYKWEYLCRVIDAAKAAVATMIPEKAVA